MEQPTLQNPPPPPPKWVQEVLDFEHKLVSDGGGDSNIPMLHVPGPNGKLSHLVALAVPKHQYASIAASTTALLGVNEFVFVMSAWASTDYVPGRAPSDDPNRKHARILSYCKRGEPTRMWQLFYILDQGKSATPSAWRELVEGTIQDKLMGAAWKIRDAIDRDPKKFADMMRKMK